MFSRAFVTVCDENYFTGLLALLNSIEVYYGRELRVFVVSHRMTDRQMEIIERHPLGHAITCLDTRTFPRPPAGAWEAKQLCLSELVACVETACLVDSDLVLLSRIDDVFALAEEGYLVSSQDGNQGCNYGANDAVYSPQLPGQGHPHFNSGFFCMNLRRHWEIVALWEFTARFAAYSPGGGQPFAFPGYGDQGILNAVTAVCNKTHLLHMLPEATWCNSVGWTPDCRVEIQRRDGKRLDVSHSPGAEQQRILHSSGPKWWTDGGRAHFGCCGDVLNCFLHFANQFDGT